MLSLRLSLSWILLLLLATAPAAHALVFVVDTTSNASDALLTDDLCDTGAGQCSLRAAIEQANSTAGADRIEFAIPAPAPVRIEFGFAPEITETLSIDATTQPGASVNTATTGTNAVHGVRLVGTDGVGFLVSAANVEIRGVHIQGSPGMTVPCVHFGPTGSGSRFLGNTVVACDAGGVRVDGDRVRIGQSTLGTRNLISLNGFGVLVTGNESFIVNNLIGTQANGTFGSANQGPGIELAGDGNRVTDNVISANTWGLTIDGDGNSLLRNRIGGSGAFGLANVSAMLITGSANQIGLPSPTLAHANEIVGNNNGMQILAPGGDNLVQGNRFGGPGLTNSGPAIDIRSSSGNTISGNQISNNIAGVSVVDSPSTPAIDNEIVENRIWGNSAYSIRLSTSGSPHDDAVFGLPPDYDEGPNHLQNPPHVTYAGVEPGLTTVAGYIDAQAGPYTLDFFSNPLCVGSRRDGEFYLGAAHLDATGTATDPRTFFSYNLPVTASGRGFTATATDADGNTSEFSTCYTSAVTGGAELVLTGSLSGPNLNPGDTLRLSLRLENRGPFVATNVPVVVSLPPGFLSAWSTTDARFNVATNTWTVPSLANGAAALLDLDATAAPAAAGNFVVNAEAVFGLGQYDPNSLNNVVRLSAFVRSGADLVVSQVAPVSAQDGDLVTIDVMVRNAGPEDASSVTLNGTLDEGLVFDSSEALPFRFSYDPATRSWTWDAQDLADQATASLRLYARVDAALAPDPALRHTVSAFAVSPTDPLPTLSTKVVGLGGTADLHLILDRNWDNGQLLEGWFSTVGNRGPDSIGGFVWRIECSGAARLYELRSSSGSRSATCPGTLEEAMPCPLICAYDHELPIDGQNVIKFSSDPAAPSPDAITVSVEMLPGFPFYDELSGDNSATWLPGTGAAFAARWRCGLLGIESPIFLGLFLLLRGRKGRAAFRRIFPTAALVVALLLGGSARTAQATPAAFAIDSSASSATVALTSTLGSPPPVAVTLSGSVAADVTLGSVAPFGLVAQSLQLTGAAIALSDFSIELSSVLLYELTFSGNDVGGSLAGPSTNGFPVAPGLSLFDLFGSSLSFDTGTIAATGTYYGFPVSESFDLSSFPLVSVFPINSVAQLQVIDLGSGTNELRLTFPFSVPLNLVIDTEPVTVTIAGTLVAVGQVVPEPGTAPLLAAGLLAFAMLRRRSATPSSR